METVSQEDIKSQLGLRAAELVQPGMTVGLGTGTTAYWFIMTLAKRCREGLDIRAVASSQQSTLLAQKNGIPLVDIDSVKVIDLTVDGADEIDEHKRMIKGGGGALVREKIVAAMSRELLVIIDESKLVKQLGKRKLPVEIIPFGHLATERHLNHLGYRGLWRSDAKGGLFTSDNSNYIFDLAFPAPLDDPEKVEAAIHRVPGVVDTGFFFQLAGRVMIGFNDGQIAIKP